MVNNRTRLGGFAERGMGLSSPTLSEGAVYDFALAKCTRLCASKLPSDAKRQFWFVSVDTEMNKKTHKRVLAVLVQCKSFSKNEFVLSF